MYSQQINWIVKLLTKMKLLNTYLKTKLNNKHIDILKLILLLLIITDNCQIFLIQWLQF